MSNTYLNRTFGTATNRKKCTLSVWLKRGKFDNSAYHFFFSSYNSGSDRLGFYFNTGDTLDVYCPGTNSMHVATNRKFRDPAAWYHVFFKCDTTQSTASDRVKIYVNGQLETDLGQNTYPNQNDDLAFGTSSYNLYIGNYDGSQYFYNGSMSHMHFCDGYAYEPTEFGSVDATTGEWKINAAPNVSYGNQGFLILKDGNTITDQSSNSNNFSSNGTGVTKTEDNPSNVFATLNPLQNHNGATLSHGNTVTTKSGAHAIVPATLACGWPGAPSTAKFYWETKVNTAEPRTVGLIKSTLPPNSSWYNDYMGSNTGGDGLMGHYIGTYADSNNSSWEYNGQSAQTVSVGFSVGDVMTHAYDASTGKYWQGKNGVWFTYGGGVGDPANGNYPIFTANATDRLHDIFPAESSYEGRWSWNFGNGYFKTTAVSSAGTNASNLGIFEYNVPTGFTALCTKGYNL